jgi:hypothetical protein
VLKAQQQQAREALAAAQEAREQGEQQRAALARFIRIYVSAL